MFRPRPRSAWPARATITRRLSTIAGFYRYAVEEELLDHSPAAHVRRPRIDYESHAVSLDRNEPGALLVAAGLGPAMEHALISLLALNGLRVSEATGASIEAMGIERGHRTLVITRKGGKVVTIPLAPRTARAIDLAIGERCEGPIFLDFAAPIQTVDLSRLNGRADETVAMTLACVSSWGQAAVDEPGGPVRLVVRDELWRALRVPAMIRKVDPDLRLSRAQGTIQVLATHRLADFEAAGAAGSEEVTIATNLIASCDVRICLHQDTAPLAMTREAIGLTDTECAHIASWTGQQIGRAVWKVGRSASHVVQLILTAEEKRLYWTNERMAL